MPTVSLLQPVTLSDGRALRMTVAEPPGVVRGGLVVLPGSRGVTEPVRALLAGLAAERWLVVAPHTHPDGTDPDQGLDAGSPVGGAAGEPVLADTDVALGWLARHGIDADRIGVAGFELGGSVAVLAAARRGIGAAVTVAGGGILRPLAAGLPALVEVAGELRCPWLGLYGDEAVDEVERLREAASRAATATDVVLFPAVDHPFDVHPDGAPEAWQRMLNWFDAHLR